MMANLKLGLRRLYKAVGLTNSDSLSVNIARTTPDGLSLRVYIGGNPPFGPFSYALPNYGYVGADLRPELVNHGVGTYVLLSVTWGKTVSAKTIEKARTHDGATRAALFSEINSKEAEFQRILDALAGMLALRTARQLVMEPIDECPYFDWGVDEGATQYTTGGALVLAPIALDAAIETGSREVIRLIEGMSRAQLEVISVPLHWLLKAWHEKDEVAKFVYMFIPLESVLPRPEQNPEIAAQMAALKLLVSTAPDESQQLLGSFMQIIEGKMSPSLVDRFVAVGNLHNVADRATDLVAFKKFYKMRNDLVHRGKRAINSRVNVEQETRTLQQLAEKYIRIVHLATLGPGLDPER